MELAFLGVALVILAVESTLHWGLPRLAARLAPVPGPTHRMELTDALRDRLRAPSPEPDRRGYRQSAGGAIDPTRLPWPDAFSSPAVEFHPPRGAGPAVIRIRTGADPTIAGVRATTEGGELVLSTHLLPAVTLFPYVLAFLPLFVSLVFGPPTIPGVVFTVSLVLGWTFAQVLILRGWVRLQVERTLARIAVHLAEVEGGEVRSEAGAAGAAPTRRRRARRR
ncbi:MAG: hypothetical protein ACFCGT_25415 [Sandaracinaceae bacterium]